MDLSNLKDIKLDDLELDFQNPRISEFGLTKDSSQKNILQVLWNEMAVTELIYSIVANGFWQYEPLIVIENERDKYTVIEGNRRLAAVMLIHNHDQIDDCTLPPEIEGKITDELLKETSKLPTIEVNSREESWKFVGFKHVNGPAKWGSYAKAQYIAEIHNDFNVPLSEIASQIGDTHNTVQKLYQGLMVLKQAEREKVYTREEIQANRLYFSHLYTGLQRSGIQEFLDLKDPSVEDPDPVSQDKVENLGELLEWLYGSTQNKTSSVIRSQNPDLKRLDKVLVNEQALSALRDGEELSYAYELSRPDDALLKENLSNAKRSLQKALSYLVTGYDGDRKLLETSGTIAEIADAIYEKMQSQYHEKEAKKKSKRITE